MNAQTAEPSRPDFRVKTRDFSQVLTKHWVVVVAAGLLGLVLGLLASTQLTPSYTATSTLYVSVRTPSDGATGALLEGANFAQAAMPSYTDVVKTTLVLDQVSEELEHSLSPTELDWAITADFPPDSVLLKITAAHDNPYMAARIANTTGDVFTTVVEDELETDNGGENSPVQVQTVDSAEVPEPHDGSHYIRNGTIGLFIGLLVGTGVGVVRELLDTRVHTAKDLEHVTNLPVLGRIPNDERLALAPLIVHDTAHPARAEAFRMLRTNLQFLKTDGPETYTITSAVPGDGKTHVVANLAIVLAESGARVTVIDADMRKPRLASVMGIEGAAGLSDILINRVSLHDVLQPWGTRELSVLPAGQIPPNPSELLGSQVMLDLVRELEKVSDYVLIDTPPVLPVTDAAVASTLATGTLLVVSLDQTKWREVVQTVETIETVESKLLGFVTNRDTSHSAAISGSGYAPTYTTPEVARPVRADS